MFNSADLHTFAPEEKIKYHNDMTTERDIRNQIAYAHDTGLAEGREAGLAEGLEKGIEKGIVEGKAEVAAKMKACGMSIEDISELTGLNEDQIQAL